MLASISNTEWPYFLPLRQTAILFLFPQGSPDTKENESNSLREKGFEFQKPRTWGINKRFGIKCDPSEPVFSGERAG